MREGGSERVRDGGRESGMAGERVGWREREWDGGRERDSGREREIMGERER